MRGWLLLIPYPLGDVAVDTKDATAVDEDLGEDVEDRVVDFSGRWEHEGNECHDDATGEEDDGGQFFERPLPTSPGTCAERSRSMGGTGFLILHMFVERKSWKDGITEDSAWALSIDVIHHYQRAVGTT